MKYKLKDICIEITDGSHFSPKGIDDGYPMFSVKDMDEFGFNYANCKYISEEDFEIMKKNGCVPQKGDVLVAKDGSYLKEIFVCEENKEEAVLSSIAIFRPNINIVQPEFLCFLLKTPYVYNYIKSNCVSGSALPRIVLKAFKDVVLDIPKLDVQSKISKICSSINYKIRINNEINDNLQQQSLALFNNFYDSILGNEVCFQDNHVFGKLIMGQSPKGESYNTDMIGVPLINGAADYTNMILTPQKFTSAPTRVCKKNDLVFCIRATIGLLVFADKEYCLGRGVASISDTNDEFVEFIYHIINRSIEHLKNQANGSVIVGINKDDILKLKIKMPSLSEITEFHKLQKPLFNTIEKLRLENIYLKELRDTLLPKLMSGEIDVSNIKLDL